jgi:uncharacterized protein (DUF302 family)
MSELHDVPYQGVRRERSFATDYDRFTGALEAHLGVMNVGALATLPGQSLAEARKTLQSFVGPSGFSLFQKLDHGGLLTALAGQPTRAQLYVVGNALIAIEMTKHVASAGLYVPLRLLVRERGPSLVSVDYDLPSAVLAQFGSPAVDAVARSLDDKIEELLAAAAAG